MKEHEIGTLRFGLDLSLPLYEQIVNQMRGSIARGEIALGEKVPSVRELAQGLKINPNTVMSAYKELERDGLTETRRGQGTFITHSQETVDQFRSEWAEKAIDDFIEKMDNLGYSLEDISSIIQRKKEGRV
ncbi:GntR family transcriptional regulator [Marininema halotolerans]|uniref:GntR family transcriptional regulator n=1 Tax=Marininema halotolerans TaxID=1155944 RepID=A0A1I6U4H3_9BACL|nr:GntR family transcriptional regulator [Marininema halotolerans]SFS96409.1 GntR family transcriptional regulator [Marininema halotolerans]